MDHPLLFYCGKRPQNSKDGLRKEIIEYIKNESTNSHTPSKRELQSKFHCSLAGANNFIKNLYLEAGVDYALAPNQEEKIKKATTLLEIILCNLDKWGLKLISYQRANQRGIDIVAEKDCYRIGVELKAYSSREAVKKKDFLQVKKAIISEKLHKAMIITTTDKIQTTINFEDNITLETYSSLCKILPQEYIAKINNIRNETVNKKSHSKEINKKRILDYVLTEYTLHEKKPTCVEIANKLNLHIYTYFDSFFTIYKQLNILPPTTKMRGARSKNPDKELIGMWKTEFKKYILKEVALGKYPSGEKIGKNFGVSHIWNIVKVSELYNELGLPHYRRMARKNKLFHTPQNLYT